MSTSPEVIHHRRNGAPVDCHVLHFGEPAAWLDRCLASLEAEPLNVVIVRGGFPGNIGAARAHAIAQGTAPYWTFVDADDWLEAGIVARCTQILEQRPDLVGIYTDYHAVDPAGNPTFRTRKRPWTPLALLGSCWEVLHYHQYRRAPTLPHLSGLANVPCYEETYLAGVLARAGDFLHLPEIGYWKRDGGQSLRLQKTALLRRIFREIAPHLMEAERRWTATKRAA
ncbi:MAG: glycosyltransferase family 2 protein [Candidatus Competibacteraceae bacterium]